MNTADFVACHKSNYVQIYDVLEGIKPGGTFLLNSNWTFEEMETMLPARMRRFIADNKLKFYNLDAVKIANAVGLGGRINMIMQTAFFKLANVLPVEEALMLLKGEIKKVYGNKGEKIIQMNMDAVDQTLANLQEINYPESWKDAVGSDILGAEVPAFVEKVMNPILSQQGDKLPVSAFQPDGVFPVDTARYEKRGVAINVPEWIIDNCIQCNQCAFVCPHAAIIPILATDAELAGAPAAFETRPSLGKELKAISSGSRSIPWIARAAATVRISALSKKKALVMKPIETQTGDSGSQPSVFFNRSGQG